MSILKPRQNYVSSPKIAPCPVQTPAIDVNPLNIKEGTILKVIKAHQDMTATKIFNLDEIVLVVAVSNDCFLVDKGSTYMFIEAPTIFEVVVKEENHNDYIDLDVEDYETPYQRGLKSKINL